MDAASADPQRMFAVVKRAALAVHRALGPGLAEVVYRNALCVELQHQVSFPVAMEVVRVITYRGVEVGHHRHDVMCGNTLVEIKVVKTSQPTAAVTSAHTMQAQRYAQNMRQTDHLVMVVFGADAVVATLHLHPRETRGTVIGGCQ